MSLFDTDKNSLDRGAPSPNRPDVVSPDAVMAHKTISTHYSTDADTNPGYLQMQNKQLIGDDGTTPITLYGYNQALNKWGFFVTQPGIDVTTNTDLSKFIFNSAQDVLKVSEKGTAVLGTQSPSNGTITSQSVTVSFTKSYTSKPLVLALVTNSGTGATGDIWNTGAMVIISAGATTSGVSLTAIEERHQTITTTNVTFSRDMYTGGITGASYPGYSLLFYVLQESAQ
jgi:hypothetical protein